MYYRAVESATVLSVAEVTVSAVTDTVESAETVVSAEFSEGAQAVSATIATTRRTFSIKPLLCRCVYD
jgi:hypothetical protein